MNLSTLLKLTPKSVITSSYDVDMLKYALKKSPDNPKMNRLLVTLTQSRNYGSHRTHKTQILLKRDSTGKPLSVGNVLVECTCEYFLYNCEWALWNKGAANIKFCNGDPPDIKNPGYIPHLCKHLTAIAHIAKLHKL